MLMPANMRHGVHNAVMQSWTTGWPRQRWSMATTGGYIEGRLRMRALRSVMHDSLSGHSQAVLADRAKQSETRQMSILRHQARPEQNKLNLQKDWAIFSTHHAEGLYREGYRSQRSAVSRPIVGDLCQCRCLRGPSSSREAGNLLSGRSKWTD